MAVVFQWDDFVAETVRTFPECEESTLMANTGDIGALVMHLSAAHDLTFAEAAEMVAIRLPVFVEEERRLSA